MKNTDTVQSELLKFGLTVSQAKIYLLLIEYRELRVQEIANLAGMPRSSVYEDIKKLYELGIAEEVIYETYKKVRPYSVGIMLHGLDEKIIEIRRLKNDLEALEKTLNIQPAKAESNLTSVRYYRNRSGARQLYWNTLKANNTVYVYSDWGRGRYVGMRYYERFVAESRKRQIRERVLINISPSTLESIRVYSYPGSPISRTKLSNLRVLDSKKVLIKGDTLIYDNVYAQIYLKNIEINGFEIESKQFVETQRAIYEVLWENATPIQEFLA